MKQNAKAFFDNPNPRPRNFQTANRAEPRIVGDDVRSRGGWEKLLGPRITRKKTPLPDHWPQVSLSLLLSSRRPVHYLPPLGEAKQSPLLIASFRVFGVVRGLKCLFLIRAIRAIRG